DQFLSEQPVALTPPSTSCDPSALALIRSWYLPISGWQPPATSGTVCTTGQNLGIFHIVGGVGVPFRGWGGGLGVALEKLNGRNPEATTANPDVDRYLSPALDTAKGLCVPTAANPNGLRPELCPPIDGEYATAVAALDVSSYEGVSFWARRGPTSQAGIRVMVGDKNTDDDLNFLAQEHNQRTGSHDPLYCARVKACGCLYGGDCKFSDDFGIQWCADPCDPATVARCTTSNNFGAATGTSNTSSPNGGSTNCQCGAHSVCDAPYPAFAQSSGQDPMNATSNQPENLGDPQFFGKPCTPFAFPDVDASSYCFDPATESPAIGSERCGDHWMKTVTLTTDWQFFKVPFADLRQQGWAKKFDHLETHAVSVVRFTWDVGFIDYWIDDFSFYRAKN
ncbi:MAG TPA: hypothetical protein VGI10_15295, partial [Polyangiaceae bacterium]